MLTQNLPRSAEVYAADQRSEIAAAVSAVRRQWRKVSTLDFDGSYLRVEPTLLAIVRTAQERVAEGAQEYVPAVLEDTGQVRAIRAAAEASTSPLVGVAGDGRPVSSLLYESVIGAKVAVAQGATATEALVSQGKWLSMAVGTLLSDTGRQSEALAMGLRPIGGYVRMLNPPSCSRCVILAGKRYSAATAFQRHPGCDCRHIPASESVANDLTVDPQAYVESLTADQQDKLLGRAGAEAVRDGADLNQVVNARRGMRPAQIGGRNVLVTSEGTTRRGLAFNRLATRGTVEVDGELATRITRTGPELRRITRTVARRPRLMPETIAQVATGKDDYLRLLRANGYLR